MKLLRDTGVYDWDGYITHLDSQPQALDRAIEVASTEATCLICYEADPLDCHRRIIADRLTSRLDLNRTDI
jgi:uncharacterized protein (DUF488 family)